MVKKEKCDLLGRGRVVMRPAVNRRPERRWFDPSRPSKSHLRYYFGLIEEVAKSPNIAWVEPITYIAG